MSVFPRLFLFYRVFGCFSAKRVQKHHKKRFAKKSFCKKIVLQKNRVEKFLQKIDQKSETDFFAIFFYHVFGRFSVRGVQKHDKNLTPVLFLPLTHPPTTGVPGYSFFGGPLRGFLGRALRAALCAAAAGRLSKGPAPKKIGDPRGGWVGQSTKKD
jgi:hypothetical protein